MNEPQRIAIALRDITEFHAAYPAYRGDVRETLDGSPGSGNGLAMDGASPPSRLIVDFLVVLQVSTNVYPLMGVENY